MTNAAPEPFHNPMESELECDLANDRVAVLEADLAAMTEDRDSWQAQCIENSKMLKEWERKKYVVSMTLDETRRDLAAAREEARHMQGDALVIREVAERITKEGTDAPLDPLWLYERMCEVIEVIDSGYLLARYQPADQPCPEPDCHGAGMHFCPEEDE